MACDEAGVSERPAFVVAPARPPSGSSGGSSTRDRGGSARPSSSSSSSGSSSAARSASGRTDSISSSGVGGASSRAICAPTRCSASARSASSSGLRDVWMLTDGRTERAERGASRTPPELGGERPETGTTDRGPAVGMGERRSEGPTGHGCAEVDGPFDRGGPEGGGALGGLFEGPPVSASTLRTSACGSTGRAKNPLAAPEGSSENASSCGRSTPRNRMSSRAPPITLRAPATASAAPTASASTTITLGVCTATRAASSDSGTSTTR